MEALLRKEFASEIAAQRERTPDLNFILLLARIEARNRRHAKIAAIESWSEILLLGTIAAILAVWWDEATAGLEALLPLADVGISGATTLGLATGLFTMLLFWPKMLARHS